MEQTRAVMLARAGTGMTIEKYSAPSAFFSGSAYSFLEHPMAEYKLVNCAAVLVVPDVRKTADWYREKLGFRVVEKFDSPEPFAAIYRDSIELVLVQSKFGAVERNRIRYGAGYDAFLAPESPEGVDGVHAEFAGRGVRIVQAPAWTPYGVYEFVFEDADGRWIGVGCIRGAASFEEKVR
jgi:catechol 2,3-dioxygenase-like lactoylglutathione lyase family enzyme